MRFRLKSGYSVPLLFVQRTVVEDRPRKRLRRFVGVFRGTGVLIINILSKIMDLLDDAYMIEAEEQPDPGIRARYFAVDIDPVTVTLRVKEIDGEIPSAQCFETITVEGERGSVVGERHLQESPVPRLAQARDLRARMAAPGGVSGGGDVLYFDGDFSEMLRKEPSPDSDAQSTSGEEQ